MATSPRRFADRQSADEWLTITFEPWAAGLTDAQRQAVNAYKFDAFEEINPALRIGLDPDSYYEQLIEDLDSALARFRLPEPIVVYRGFVDLAVREAPVGSKFVDFAFFSTSLLRSVAEGLISVEAESERALGELVIPGGVEIGAFVGAPDLVRQMDEAEVLLPRASRFRITGRHAADHIDLEVII